MALAKIEFYRQKENAVKLNLGVQITKKNIYNKNQSSVI